MNIKAIRKYSLLIIVVFFLSLLLVRFLAPESKELDFQLAIVTPISFDINVNTVGVLDAARSHMVSSAIKGDKGKIIYLIDDGVRVKKGDILVRLDPTPFEKDVHRLTGEVRSYEAAVKATEQVVKWEKNQMEREIKTGEFDIRVANLERNRLEKGEGPLQLSQFKSETEKAKQEYTRHTLYTKDLEDLSKKGYTNPTEIEQAREKVEQFREAYEAAKNKYLSYKDYVLPSLIETTKAKLQKAEMQLEQARKGNVFKVAKAIATMDKTKRELENVEATLEQAQGELDKSVIHAPFPGIAILHELFRDNQKRKPRVGDTVWQNQPLLYLPDISSMIVKTQVREVDLHKLVIGQETMVQVDAYPNVLFEGKVTSIGVLATERFETGRGEKYFQLTVYVKGEDARLRPGMTARISILTDNVKNALSVPIQAIFNEGGRKYSYLHTKNSFKKVEVSLGRQNEDMAEILSGLKKGDKVSLVKPPQEEIWEMETVPTLHIPLSVSP